jgi:hypothetical protein
MSFRTAALIIIPLLIQIIVATIMGHFAAHTTGGIVVGFTHAVPTSGWDVITNGFGFFGAALTFNVVGYALISIFFWVLTVIQFIGVILAVRGV